MVWMKAWMEMQWRLIFALAIILFALATRYFGKPPDSVADAQRLWMALGAECIFMACFLAGSGVKTQVFRQAKGVHESVYFTLSLPVSRLRLLAVRTAVGIFGTWVVAAIGLCAAWSLFPLVRGHSTIGDLAMFLATAFAFLTLTHIVSIIFAIAFDEPWASWGSLVPLAILLWLLSHAPMANPFNILGAVTAESPLLTHTLPWSQLAVCIGLDAALFIAVARLLESWEF